MTDVLRILAAICFGLACASLALASDAPLTVTPSFLRCEVPPGETREVALELTSASAATLIAAESDCRCVRVTTPLPTAFAAATPLRLTLAVAGALPGMKTLTLRTSAGAIAARLQVISGGLGAGRDQVAEALAAAARLRGQVWFVLHDLRGEVRNCGCSDGSLGGLDHLAALPRLCREIAPEVPARFVLLGDTEGMRTGVTAALMKDGWRMATGEVIASAQPERDLAGEAVAIVPTVPVAVNHAKLVRIPLDGGVLVAALVVVDGRLREQRLIAVDRSLPADAATLAGFAGALTRRVDASADPSAACLGCHAAAHGVWAASAHARAWTSLPEADRVDACVDCHSTPLANGEGALATGVHCQACHQGADAHAAAPASVHTAGATDCRSCHDERRHPSFQRDPAWALIRHAR